MKTTSKQNIQIKTDKKNRAQKDEKLVFKKQVENGDLINTY